MQAFSTYIDRLPQWRDQALEVLLRWLTSPAFYGQVIAALAALLLAWLAARWIRRHVPIFGEQPQIRAQGLLGRLLQLVASARDLLWPFLLVAFLAVAISVADAAFGRSWLVRLAQSAALIWLLYAAIQRWITHPVIRSAAVWLGIPVATLHVFGWYDAVAAWLDGISLSVGNIRLSLYFLIKAAIFGGLFFWLGRITTEAGQNAIRRQEALDRPTRELFAKLFELGLYFVIFILLLQVLGLDLTALAIFGGAIGVGLGFGLQQIAANFISGIIILLERSLTVGDYVELEDGKAGIVKRINMRSSVLETFDGKEIVVPNEKFITTRFVNWTHDDPRQRYEVEFWVAYDTDLHKVPPVIEAAVARHPRVLDAPEKPDCELKEFGERGVRFTVEFWVEGLDDGPNKFSSDVMFLIWDALKENGIRIPLPRQEVVLVQGGEGGMTAGSGQQGEAGEGRAASSVPPA